MSTIVAPPEQSTLPLTGPKRSKKTKVCHLFTFEDAEFAREIGIQVRTYCGVWIHPGRPNKFTPADAHPANRCKRCQRIYESRLNYRFIEQVTR